ncbi:MAG: hypothetical protein CL662_12905 [Bacteroidetes bacterium]|nr:hypothetical protein [Bacteroidota bacterium]MAC06650.1 hypothetical protein [Balneola sp.]MAO77739.1 hypothetical protein [Balneola sp.]MBF63880.1 hypothetical protein [Balneola sp.]HBZ37351.1 hypothetical protein [Balneola sp.]
MNISNFIQELKRRNVFKVATAYAVSAWLLIQISATVFPFIGVSSFWVTTIIIILGIGFPVSLVIGWVFELTSEGVKKSDEVDITESVTAATSKKLNVIIISVLTFTVLFLLVERIFFARANILESEGYAVQRASIAVLPFVDMSPEQDQEYFSDGLSEELLNVMAKVEDLQVSGRTSSFQYKGKNLDLRLIGQELGVEHVLEGSVRKSGDNIRITAQLIKADNGFHMWSETYDKVYSAENLFTIQDEISQQVLEELKIRLLPEKEELLTKELTTNTDAYDLYLQANQLLVNRRPQEIENAIKLFNEVIELDPEFASAYARLAIAYNLLSNFGNISHSEMLNLMRKNIDRALLIDGNLGWAYAALGKYYLYSGNSEEAQIALNKAHELIPGDPEIMLWYSDVAPSIELSEELVKRAYETDPYSPITIDRKARLHYHYDEFAEAFSLMEKNLEINPEYSAGLSLKAFFIKDQPYGKLDESFILGYQAYLKEPGNLEVLTTLAYVSLDLGFLFIVDKIEEDMKKHFPDNIAYLSIRYDHMFHLEDYEAMLKLQNKLEEATMSSSSDPQHLLRYLEIYINAGKLNLAKEFVELNYPEVLDPNSDYPDLYPQEVAWLSVLYDKLGEKERAKNLSEAACSMIEETLEFESEIEKETAQNSFAYLDCIAIKKDQTTLLALVETIHFDRNAKANLYTFMDRNPIYDFARSSPEYIELRKKIEQDIEGMRKDAITWLKVNNHWKPSWEVHRYSY